MKSALRPEMWPRTELKLQWFDKLLMTVVRLDVLSVVFVLLFVSFCSYIIEPCSRFSYQLSVIDFEIACTDDCQ